MGEYLHPYDVDEGRFAVVVTVVNGRVLLGLTGKQPAATMRQVFSTFGLWAFLVVSRGPR